METESKPIIEIRKLIMAHAGPGDHAEANQLMIHQKDMVSIDGDALFDVRHLLRVLATLDQPVLGEYRFKGMPVDLSSYQQCLAVKRQIGYVAADAAMISNRTLKENLLLMRYYHENDLRIDLDETVRCLCNAAGLTHKLDQRPATLSGIELLKAIAVREFSKMPAVMLMEFPEHFMQIQQRDAFFLYLKKMIRLDSAVVFFTKNSKLLGLANRRLMLAGGTIRTTPT